GCGVDGQFCGLPGLGLVCCRGACFLVCIYIP
uniref:Kappa-conotoxin SrVIA n=1 Tax=Conus spurius TaxID=192919 RepID=O16A_CONSP